jgi:hypothetical protein
MPVNLRPDNLAKKIKEQILGVPQNMVDTKAYKRKPLKIDKYILQEPRGTAGAANL